MSKPENFEAEAETTVLTEENAGLAETPKKKEKREEREESKA